MRGRPRPRRPGSPGPSGRSVAAGRGSVRVCGPNRMPARDSSSASRRWRLTPRPRAARARGSRSPAIIASMTSRAVTWPGQLRYRRRQLDRASSSSFSSRCHHRVRSAARSNTGRVRTRSARISGGGTNEGRSRPISVSRAIQLGVLPVGLRPARQAAGPGRSSPAARQPGGLQQENHIAPVIARGFHRRHLHAAAPSAARPAPRSPAARAGTSSHSRRALLRPPGRGQPGAHVRLRLRQVDPRDPLVTQLVVLMGT